MDNSNEQMRKFLNLSNDLFKSATRANLSEGFTGNHNGPLERKFDEIEDKFVRARRALGLINKSSMSAEEKKLHASKMMRHINNFRTQLKQTMSELGMSEKEMQSHTARIGLDREFGKPSEVFTKPDYNASRQKAAPAPAPVAADPRPSATVTPIKKDSWYDRFKAIISGQKAA